MSERTQLNFDIAMMGGTLMIRNGNVFFLGPGGSGKTHTLAALIEEDPPSVRESTPCAKKPVRAVAQCKVGVKGVQFVRIEDDQYSDMLSRTAKQFNLQLQQSSTSTTTPPPAQPRPHGTTSDEVRTAETIDHSELSNSDEVDIHLNPPPPKKIRLSESSDSTPNKQKQKPQSHRSGLRIEFLRRMQAVTKSCEDLNNRDLFNMRDSGGQPMFHEVLPLFVQNTTFGVLTVKLNESLDSHPLVEYYSSGKPVGEPFKSSFTHLQTIHHCMRVLQSTCDHNTCPKMIFVGTHKDLEHECKPKESHQEKNQKLQKIVPPSMRDSIIYCDESLKELLFAVNVKTPGDDDRKTIGHVREMMIKELQKLPRRRIPLQYFALENAFLRLARYQHKAVLSKEECFNEAAAYHFTRESLEAALKFLHSLKLIFYYEEILPDVVFIDAQTLLDKITELVEYSLSLKSKHNIQNVPVALSLIHI